MKYICCSTKNAQRDNVRNLSQGKLLDIKDNKKMNILLAMEENSHNGICHINCDLNIYHWFVQNFL